MAFLVSPTGLNQAPALAWSNDYVGSTFLLPCSDTLADQENCIQSIQIIKSGESFELNPILSASNTYPQSSENIYSATSTGYIAESGYPDTFSVVFTLITRIEKPGNRLNAELFGAIAPYVPPRDSWELCNCILKALDPNQEIRVQVRSNVYQPLGPWLAGIPTNATFTPATSGGLLDITMKPIAQNTAEERCIKYSFRKHKKTGKKVKYCVESALHTVQTDLGIWNYGDSGDGSVPPDPDETSPWNQIGRKLEFPYVATDGDVANYRAPIFDKNSGQWNFSIWNSHFQADGSTLTEGFFQARLPGYALDQRWRDESLSSSYGFIRQDGNSYSLHDGSVVANSLGGVDFTIPSLHYSKPVFFTINKKAKLKVGKSLSAVTITKTFNLKSKKGTKVSLSSSKTNKSICQVKSSKIKAKKKGFCSFKVTFYNSKGKRESRNRTIWIY